MSNSKYSMNLINSNDISLLASLCSKVIKDIPTYVKDDPFSTEKVVVMNKGMQTYLQQEIALQSGVCAGVDFNQVWAFIWDLHKKINNADKFNRYDHEHLTWSLFELKDKWADKNFMTASGEKIFESMHEYINIDSEIEDESAKAYQLCGVIADAFDQYQMYRPDWIEIWNNPSNKDFDDVVEEWIKAECKRNSANTKRIEESFTKNKWQVMLWQLLKANMPKTDVESSSYDRPTVIRSLIETINLFDENKVCKYLPKRVFVFGVTALPSQVISLFITLGKFIPVFFMNLNPCKEYWGDLQSGKKNWNEERKTIIKYLKANALEQKIAKFNTQNFVNSPKQNYDLVQIDDIQEDDDNYYNSYKKFFDESAQLVEGNPLLVSLGRQGRDTLNELISSEDEVDVTNIFINNVNKDDESSYTLLNNLKDDLLSLFPREKKKIKLNDRSLQIRKCHTIKRELEILRDEILSLFKQSGEGQKLSPRNMLVMVPNIEEYAPYIESVFGTIENNDPNFVPYSICDKTAKNSSKVADAVVSLLSIGAKKIDAQMIVELLSLEPLAKKFEISPDELTIIIEWFQNTNVHWGLDEKDVENVIGVKKDLPWTIESGVERLVNGFLLGQGTGSEAYSDIDTGDYKLLGKLCNFVEKLKEVRTVFDPQLDLDTLEWTRNLNSLLLNGFFYQDDETKEECAAIRDILKEMGDAVNNLKKVDEQTNNTEGYKSDIKIKLPVFKAKLEHAFGNNRDSSRYLRGKINFCSLMPMRAVPFDHLFLLGLNDTAFPRKDTNPNFNLLSTNFLLRRNDRNRTIDDRFIFLEAILSARKSLYLSYLGESPIDKTPNHPSVVIKELEDYICDNYYLEGMTDKESDGDNRSAILNKISRQEYLNSYNLANYYKPKPGDLRLYPSFNKSSFWKEDNEKDKDDSKSNYLPLGCDVKDDHHWPIAPQLNLTITGFDLVTCVTKPCKTFLKNSLNMDVQMKTETNLNVTEPFELERFEETGILEELIQKCLELKRSGDENFSAGDYAEEYIDLKYKKGELPTGVFFEKEKKTILDTFDGLFSVVTQLVSQNHKGDTYKYVEKYPWARSEQTLDSGESLTNGTDQSISQDDSLKDLDFDESQQSTNKVLSKSVQPTAKEQAESIQVSNVEDITKQSVAFNNSDYEDHEEYETVEDIQDDLESIYFANNQKLPKINKNYKKLNLPFPRVNDFSEVIHTEECAFPVGPNTDRTVHKIKAITDSILSHATLNTEESLNDVIVNYSGAFTNTENVLYDFRSEKRRKTLDFGKAMRILLSHISCLFANNNQALQQYYLIASDGSYKTYDLSQRISTKEEAQKVLDVLIKLYLICLQEPIPLTKDLMQSIVEDDIKTTKAAQKATAKSKLVTPKEPKEVLAQADLDLSTKFDQEFRYLFYTSGLFDIDAKDPSKNKIGLNQLELTNSIAKLFLDLFKIVNDSCVQ